MKLRFRHRDRNYFAYDDTRQYAIYRRENRPGSDWILRIRETVETAGVQHALGQPDLHVCSAETLAYARKIAQAYHDLGDDYRGTAEEGFKSRFVQACEIVHETTMTALRAEIEALRIKD